MRGRMTIGLILVSLLTAGAKAQETGGPTALLTVYDAEEAPVRVLNGWITPDGAHIVTTLSGLRGGARVFLRLPEQKGAELKEALFVDPYLNLAVFRVQGEGPSAELPTWAGEVALGTKGRLLRNEMLSAEEAPPEATVVELSATPGAGRRYRLDGPPVTPSWEGAAFVREGALLGITTLQKGALWLIPVEAIRSVLARSAAANPVPIAELPAPTEPPTADRLPDAEPSSPAKGLLALLGLALFAGLGYRVLSQVGE
ncbi:MAG: hypothetical protein KatS3mg115_2662 [Candidatus Poribacteria bacterium]|nr:MAG: hypothetical protein KatS3mg115_2662 [Candidatus Poribacteria bacterium]